MPRSTRRTAGCLAAVLVAALHAPDPAHALPGVKKGPSYEHETVPVRGLPPDAASLSLRVQQALEEGTLRFEAHGLVFVCLCRELLVPMDEDAQFVSSHRSFRTERKPCS